MKRTIACTENNIDGSKHHYTPTIAQLTSAVDSEDEAGQMPPTKRQKQEQTNGSQPQRFCTSLIVTTKGNMIIHNCTQMLEMTNIELKIDELLD